MTDIEMMIKEIKKFQEMKHNVTINKEINEHLVFLCHKNTEKIIQEALKENGLQIDKNKIHIYTSEYYEPGDVYTVKDTKLKKEILRKRGVIIKENNCMTYTYTINYDTNIQNSSTMYYTISNNSYGNWYV